MENAAAKYQIIIPTKGRGAKELKSLKRRRPQQLTKAFKQLEINPIDLKQKNIEQLRNRDLGEFTIRISKGDRLFYDVDRSQRKIFILRAGPHNLYRLLNY